jgi:type IV pilus assembly protein PilZ
MSPEGSTIDRVQQPTGNASEERPVVLAVSIKERSSLRNAYLSQFINRGLFVHTTKSYEIGQSVYCLVALPDSTEKFPIAGTVAWIRVSAGASGKPQGIGIHFNGDVASQKLVRCIEEMLGAEILSDKAGSSAW